ncbi:hypothetical protein [Sulfitobacter aestuariivivens]|nr:hypothetical protein [Sulfitobacter aestuariivivens]
MTPLFIAWAGMMFRTLFAHRKRIAQRTGRPIPGVGDSLREWRHWWRSDDLKFERRLLIFLTITLFIAVLSLPFALPQTS